MPPCTTGTDAVKGVLGELWAEERLPLIPSRRVRAVLKGILRGRSRGDWMRMMSWDKDVLRRTAEEWKKTMGISRGTGGHIH